MSRRAARMGDSAAVSLFPFLAVLICTMGSLIVLLVIVVQQARVGAADVAVSETPATPASVLTRDAEADAQRLMGLLRLRDQATEQLTAMRLSLSELEDHSRSLEDELAQLDAQAQRLAAGQTDGTDVSRLEQERAWLERQIDEAEAALEEAQRQQAGRSRSYAIVPYDGAQGTRRRPIYVECRGDRVILQPEGIELFESDFQPPLGPGNALAASLRAVREYWAQQGLLGQGGEPYPLLVVRPDGARAYSAAREAMKSWDDEFGYELIDADMTLAFPPADPRLDVLVQRALADARARQEYLVQAAPSRFGRGDGDSGGWGGGAAGGGSRDGSAAGTGIAGRGGSGTGGPSGDLALGSGSPSTTGSSTGTGEGQSGPTPNGGTGAQPGEGLAGGVGSSPYAGTEVAEGASASSGGASSATAAGERVASSAESGAGGSAGVGGNVAATGAPGAASGGSSSGSPGGSEASLAASRGSNWGLPRNDGTTIGYSRPIRVGLDPASLTIHREAGDRLQAVVVPLDRGTVNGSIDQFVAALWTYMEDWGQAGPGSFWKPVLTVEVAPGAEGRYLELARLLEGSGIEVTRK